MEERDGLLALLALPLALPHAAFWTSGDLNWPNCRSIDGASVSVTDSCYHIRPSSSALQSGGMPYLAPAQWRQPLASVKSVANPARGVSLLVKR